MFPPLAAACKGAGKRGEYANEEKAGPGRVQVCWVKLSPCLSEAWGQVMAVGSMTDQPSMIEFCME